MIETRLTIICGYCDVRSPEFLNQSANASRRVLEKAGWTLISNHDRCRHCSKAHAAKATSRLTNRAKERIASIESSKP